MPNKPEILVIGSINQDIVNYVEHFPMPGETIKGLRTEYYCGGKGANQAAAAAFAGARVTFLGAIGDDAFGTTLVTNLEKTGVNTEKVIIKSGPTGTAFITTNRIGENHIVLSEGANGLLTINDLEADLKAFETVDILLVQNEIPWQVTRYAIEQAHLRGIQVFFNPAPVVPLILEVLPLIDILVVNETEIEVLTGFSPYNPLQTKQALSCLIEAGVKTVILTLGGRGVISLNKNAQLTSIPAFKVEVVDTTGAGDTFIGALAAICQQEYDWEGKLRFANTAAALSVTSKGAQSSMPGLATILNYLK